MWPEFLSSQRYSLVLVVGCQWDLHPGVLSFFRVFFSFSLGPPFHTSQLFCFIYFLLPLLLLAFFVFFFPGTFGREKQNASLSWRLSKAPSFLLMIVPPLEAQLAFLQKQIRRCHSEAPWPPFHCIWGALSPLISLLCAHPAVPSPAPSIPTPCRVMEPLQQHKGRWDQCLAASQGLPQPHSTEEDPSSWGLIPFCSFTCALAFVCSHSLSQDKPADFVFEIQAWIEFHVLPP